MVIAALFPPRSPRYTRPSTAICALPRQPPRPSNHNKRKKCHHGDHAHPYRQSPQYVAVLDIRPTLFGECSLVREWGRIGRAGTVRIKTCRSRGAADIAMVSNWGRKLKRG
ncbi:putative DNA-binding WGR domain protein [Bradyrhizobium yuanmingense]|uniref:WGR domain-containing protein n=1 Tax=Bradyrhizobium yuanmingense TaxID=108015 RepID=UPI0035155FD3